MESPRPKFFKRIQPFVGALIFVMGGTQAILTFMKSGANGGAMMGLMMTGAGLGMIHRGQRNRPLVSWGLTLAGAAVVAALAYFTTR